PVLHALCSRVGRALIGGRRHHSYQLGEGRIAEGTPPLELLLEESGRVVAGGMLETPGFRAKRLHQHPSARGPSTAPACQLCDEREGALLGAKVRKAQGGIGIDHDGELDLRKVVSLRPHLRSNQDSRTRVGETSKEAGCPVLSPTDVAVEPEHLERRQGRSEIGFEALRPGAMLGDRAGPALWANSGGALVVPAVMTEEALAIVGAVKRQCDVAVRAGPRPTARTADQKGRP